MFTPVILALGRPMPEGNELLCCLVYIARPCIIKKNLKKKTVPKALENFLAESSKSHSTVEK
jgi:hypothetical protein